MGYVRPQIVIDEFRDPAGRVINYGRRWVTLSGHHLPPPDAAYSTTSHPERFGALLTVAKALTDHLVQAYSVSVTEAGQSVTLSPELPDQARLRFDTTWDGHGLTLRAGAGTVWVLPSCGCDACDDDVLELIDELEDHVFGLVGGGFTETLEGNSLSYEVTASESTYAGGRKMDSEDLPAVRAQLTEPVRRLSTARRRQWQAWNPRQVE